MAFGTTWNPNSASTSDREILASFTANNANNETKEKIGLFTGNYSTYGSRHIITGWGIPAFERAFTLARQDGTVTWNGFLFVKNNDNASSSIIINGFNWYLDGSYGNEETALIPVPAGATYSSSNWGTLGTFYFVPMSGQ